MRTERCETCRFWERTERGDLYEGEIATPWMSDTLDEHDPLAVEIGQCKRFPPQLHQLSDKPTDNLAKSAWPMSWLFDWCGEWKPKKK